MIALLVGLAIAAAAGALAWLIERRRVARDAPVAPPAHHVPTRLEPSDFGAGEASWLVAVFTSSSCSSCADVMAKAEALSSAAVAVVEVEVGTDPDLHLRYGIDAVPTTVITDDTGVVRRSFLGPVSATHLWAAVAEVRSPGSVPEGCGEDH